MTPEWQRIAEYIVLDNPEYELALEEFRNCPHQMVFIHLWVKQDWSLKLLKRFKHEFAVLRKHVTCPLFAGAIDDDDKWVKFIELFGFKPLTEFTDTDGRRRRIYWHQIDHDLIDPKTKLDLERDHDDYPVRVPAAVS